MTETDRKILSLIGFAAKARHLVVGTELCCDALRDGTVPVIVEAGDTSKNTEKRLADRTSYYGVPLIRLTESGETLAAAIGKKGQTVGAVGVTDIHLAKAIRALPAQDGDKR